MKAKFKKLLLGTGSTFLWILLWHIAAKSANKNLLFKIPLPLETFKAFLDYTSKPEFWEAVYNSIFHIVSGFVFAVVFGLICGLLSGSSSAFKIFTAPIARIIRSMPVAALIFLAWLWIPSTAIPSFIAFLMVFPIVWLQIENSLLSIDKRLIEMAKVMGMSRVKIIKNIKAPYVLPALRNSAITGLGFAWKSGVAAEVICNPTGSIGAILSGAKNNLEYGAVFAIVLTIIILSLIMENIIKLIWRESKYDKYK